MLLCHVSRPSETQADIIICHPPDSGIAVSLMESRNRPIKTASVVDHGTPSALFEMLLSDDRGTFLSRGQVVPAGRSR